MMIFPQASRLRDKLFPVDGRGNAVAGLENPGKMILVRKIEKRGNLGDRHGGIRQKIFRETDSLFDQVGVVCCGRAKSLYVGSGLFGDTLVTRLKLALPSRFGLFDLPVDSLALGLCQSLVSV